MIENEELLYIYETRTSLEDGASIICSCAPDEYKQTTYLYFLARYLVGVYEASFSSIPVQVWNEYRNAFDHFVRHITKESTDTTDHVKRIEGHVQRAVLDISKIFCHDTQDLLSEKFGNLNKKALLLIDNGTFFVQLEEAFDEAKDKFISAKSADIALGENARNNKNVLSRYLDAVYSYQKVQKILRDRRQCIHDATVRYDALHHESKKEHIILSIISKGIWVVGGMLLPKLWAFASGLL